MATPRIIFAALPVIVILFSAGVSAQPADGPPYAFDSRSPYLSEKSIIFAANQVRIPQDSKFFPSIKKMLLRRQKEDMKIEREMAKRKKKREQERKKNKVKKNDLSDPALLSGLDDSYTEPPKVKPMSALETMDDPIPTKHIRGQRGTHFTDSNILKDFIRPKVEEQIALIKQKVWKGVEKLTKKQEFITPVLPACTESETDESETSYGKKKGWDQPVFDMLFLSAEAAPDALGSYFGRNTNIRLYKANTQDYESIALLSFGVKCLPSRIRGLKGARIRHTGLAALKNYDQDYSGTGELHEEIAKNLKRYLGK